MIITQDLETQYLGSSCAPTSGKLFDLKQEKGNLNFVISVGLCDLGKVLSH